MNKKVGIWAWMRLILLSVALLTCLVLTQTPVYGAVNCATATDYDSDGDGFTDLQECNGISFVGSPNNFIYGRLNAPANLLREERLDPDTEDLFVILVPDLLGQSKIPVTPMVFISNSVGSGGLGIYVHPIPATYVSDPINRFVSSPSSGQRAVHVVESLDPGSTTEQKNTLGACDQGMVLDGCIVWTQRIENKIATICCGTPTCTSWRNDSTCKDKATNQYGQNLLDRYIRHTIAHEVGHALNLKVDPPHHSNPSTSNPKEMDSSVAVKGKVFSIGVAFTSADQTGYTQQ
jgi:hypothetical protein